MSAEVLTTQEAAALLSVHPKTLLRQVREGTIPAARVGRRWKFSKRQLLAWLEHGGSRDDRLVDQGLLDATLEAMTNVEAGRDRMVSLAEVKERLGL